MNIETSNNQEAVLIQKNEARSSHFEKIRELWSEGRSIIAAQKEGRLRLANIVRETGLHLLEAAGKEVQRFEQQEMFYREHAGELPEGFDSDTGRKCISTFKSNPNEIQDLREVEQLNFQTTYPAFGEWEEPRRALPQTATGITALEKLMSVWGKEREAIAKFETEMPRTRWTPQIWETVMRQTKDAAELHASAKEALRK